MTLTRDALLADAVETIARLRRSAPRVQCLTNTVAQPITANILLAAGARASMATHPDEVVAMSASADAVLINLGTLDAARVAAIPLLLADARVRGKPRVLDPVFIEHSPLRLALARQVAAAGPLIVKGNAREMAALELSQETTAIVTGGTDRISRNEARISIDNGHPLMALVTGLGCAAGALAAAYAAVQPDPLRAAVAAMLVFGVAGERAARSSHGPGSFAASFIDAIAAVDAQALLNHARLTVEHA